MRKAIFRMISIKFVETHTHTPHAHYNGIYSYRFCVSLYRKGSRRNVITVMTNPAEETGILWLSKKII